MKKNIKLREREREKETLIYAIIKHRNWNIMKRSGEERVEQRINSWN